MSNPVQNTEFYVNFILKFLLNNLKFPQQMAQIDLKFERKLKRIQSTIKSNYFDQIIAHLSLIDRVIELENECALSNPVPR